MLFNNVNFLGNNAMLMTKEINHIKVSGIYQFNLDPIKNPEWILMFCFLYLYICIG